MRSILWASNIKRVTSRDSMGERRSGGRTTDTRHATACLLPRTLECSRFSNHKDGPALLWTGYTYNVEKPVKMSKTCKNLATAVEPLGQYYMCNVLFICISLIYDSRFDRLLQLSCKPIFRFSFPILASNLCFLFWRHRLQRTLPPCSILQ